MNKHLSPAASAGGNRDLIAVRAAMKILDKWGCTPEQQQNILQLSKATFYRYRDEGTKSASPRPADQDKLPAQHALRIAHRV